MKTALMTTTLPTIHLNGSSAKSLLEDYMNAMDACRTLQNALTGTFPNGRDYYPQGVEALTQARNEHNARQDSVASILAQLETLAEHCADNIKS